MSHPLHVLATLSIAAGIALAGCGGDDGSSESKVLTTPDGSEVKAGTNERIGDAAATIRHEGADAQLEGGQCVTSPTSFNVTINMDAVTGTTDKHYLVIDAGTIGNAALDKGREPADEDGTYQGLEILAGIDGEPVSATGKVGSIELTDDRSKGTFTIPGLEGGDVTGSFECEF